MEAERLVTDDATTARMSRQRRADTSPELELRRLLHASGLRYRVHLPVPGQRRRTIDIAFTKARVAVFVDGCYWHACPQHATWPQRNGAWWRRKLNANVLRDRETDELLEAAGWVVVRVWEHEQPQRAAEVVAAAVRRRACKVTSVAAPKMRE